MVCRQEAGVKARAGVRARGRRQEVIAKGKYLVTRQLFLLYFRWQRITAGWMSPNKENTWGSASTLLINTHKV